MSHPRVPTEKTTKRYVIYKRVQADIPIEIHNRLKATLSGDGESIRGWLLGCIEEKLGDRSLFPDRAPQSGHAKE